MDKIASPQQLQEELQDLVAYARSASPSRVALASALRGLAARVAAKTAGSLYDTIRAGDRVTIVDRFGKEHTGRAVMRGPAGWVLNMGGAHGRPGIASEENVVNVKEEGLAPQPESALENLDQAIAVERLVERQALPGEALGDVAGHENNGKVRLSAPEGGRQLDALAVRELQVCQEHVKGTLVGEHARRLAGARDRSKREAALRAHEPRDGAAQQVFIVDEQHPIDTLRFERVAGHSHESRRVCPARAAG